MTTAGTAGYVPFREYRLLHILSAVFLAAWIASAIHPVMVEDWWLENALVFCFVAVLIVSYRWLPFSGLSYLLICIYLCMHEWGAHHRYATVPLGEWMKQVLHTERNHYDRLVHMAFGLLLAYPERELLMRKGRVGHNWALWLPVAISLALGAAYEIIEAIVACMVSPEAGSAFLALQGDPWDTQKDMFWALAGSAVAMGTTAMMPRRLTRVAALPSTARVRPKAGRAMAAGRGR
jgi:putative membrane protein